MALTTLLYQVHRQELVHLYLQYPSSPVSLIIAWGLTSIMMVIVIIMTRGSHACFRNKVYTAKLY
jgi:hypothetical protein